MWSIQPRITQRKKTCFVREFCLDLAAIDVFNKLPRNISWLAKEDRKSTTRDFSKIDFVENPHQTIHYLFFYLKS